MASVGLVVGLLLCSVAVSARYEATWESTDSRPLPRWYDESKFGIFCHWGIFSVPAYSSEWFWWNWVMEQDPDILEFMHTHYKDGTQYQDFIPEFTAIDFNATYYAELVKASGARYFVLTSKHHEGFTMWKSATSWNWNAVDIGPKRDIVQELNVSMHDAGVRFGLYFSLMDWFHPLYHNDSISNNTDYVTYVAYPQMQEIVNLYQPDVIWTDGDWEHNWPYWRGPDFLAWLYNESPVKDTVAVNDRWGRGTNGVHGGYITPSDQYDPGVLVQRKWENAMKLERYSWGYRRHMTSDDVRTFPELILKLARTISCGGNLLLNIGPDSRGRIPVIFEERLRQIGGFVSVHEEAIFGSKPWIYQNDSDTTWYTSQVRNDSLLDPNRKYNPQDMWNTVVYAFVLNIPTDGKIALPSVKSTKFTHVSLLGTTYKVPFTASKTGIIADVSGIPWQKLPFTEAIVLKIEMAATSKRSPITALTNKTKNQHEFLVDRTMKTDV
ncbi:Protein W03G11.3 [Aphelenchoides avenae]|nr:Protein W03G11.3 [Aphelenchus avenae]